MMVVFEARVPSRGHHKCVRGAANVHLPRRDEALQAIRPEFLIS